MKNESPFYFYHLLSKPSSAYSTRNSKNMSSIKDNHSFFRKHFFPVKHHGMEQIRFEYPLIFFLQAFQKMNFRIYKTSP